MAVNLALIEAVFVSVDGKVAGRLALKTALNGYEEVGEWER